MSSSDEQQKLVDPSDPNNQEPQMDSSDPREPAKLPQFVAFSPESHNDNDDTPIRTQKQLKIQTKLQEFSKRNFWHQVFLLSFLGTHTLGLFLALYVMNFFSNVNMSLYDTNNWQFFTFLFLTFHGTWSYFFGWYHRDAVNSEAVKRLRKMAVANLFLSIVESFVYASLDGFEAVVLVVLLLVTAVIQGGALVYIGVYLNYLRNNREFFAENFRHFPRDTGLFMFGPQVIYHPEKKAENRLS